MEEMEVSLEEMKVKPPLGTVEDPPPPRHRKPNGDPESSADGGGKDFRGHKHVPMSINKRAKPKPNLELPPRAQARLRRSGNCGIGHVYLE